MIRNCIGRWMAGAGLVLGMLAVAHEGFSQAPPSRPAPPRDPTTPSERIREKLTPAPRQTPAPNSQSSMPTFALRGRVLGPTSPPAALLEIDGTVYLVRKGSRISSGQVVLHVTEINTSEVRIEVDQTKQVIVLQ